MVYAQNDYYKTSQIKNKLFAVEEREQYFTQTWKGEPIARFLLKRHIKCPNISKNQLYGKVEFSALLTQIKETSIFTVNA